MIDHRLEQRLEISARVVQFSRGRPGAARGIEERRIELFVRRLEVDEQSKHFVMHAQRLGVGAVDLVDRDDRLEPQRQRLPGDEPGLRHGTFSCIHQQHEAIDHAQDPLDFATEIGVARRIHDVDLGAVPLHRGVLGKDGDAPLLFERIRVHHALFHVLVGAKRPGLPEHLVHQRGLAVVDVCDDGDVANHVCRFPLRKSPAMWASNRTRAAHI